MEHNIMKLAVFRFLNSKRQQMIYRNWGFCHRRCWRHHCRRRRCRFCKKKLSVDLKNCDQVIFYLLSEFLILDCQDVDIYLVVVVVVVVVVIGVIVVVVIVVGVVVILDPLWSWAKKMELVIFYDGDMFSWNFYSLILSSLSLISSLSLWVVWL